VCMLYIRHAGFAAHASVSESDCVCVYWCHALRPQYWPLQRPLLKTLVLLTQKPWLRHLMCERRKQL
jgi:hypothetical protein